MHNLPYEIGIKNYLETFIAEITENNIGLALHHKNIIYRPIRHYSSHIKE